MQSSAVVCSAIRYSPSRYISSPASGYSPSSSFLSFSYYRRSSSTSPTLVPCPATIPSVSSTLSQSWRFATLFISQSPSCSPQPVFRSPRLRCASPRNNPEFAVVSHSNCRAPPRVNCCALRPDDRRASATVGPAHVGPGRSISRHSRRIKVPRRPIRRPFRRDNRRH